MNKKTTTFIICTVVIVFGIWFFSDRQLITYSTNTPGIYRNDQYGFSLKFPKNLSVTTTFKQFYALGNSWRAELFDERGTGMPVVSIAVFQVDNQHDGSAQGKPYPLYFSAEVRVGVSSDSTDIENCLKPDSNYTNQPETDMVINGVTFKKFNFQNAAMMQYVAGESYRTVHNGICYAVEQIKTGSNYRDPSMLPGITDATLNQYYEQEQIIVQSFKFL